MVICLRRIQNNDDINHTNISQSNCRIGLGETITHNPIHKLHSYVDWLANKNQNISILSL
jgi:hypothetical protein